MEKAKADPEGETSLAAFWTLHSALVASVLADPRVLQTAAARGVKCCLLKTPWSNYFFVDIREPSRQTWGKGDSAARGHAGVEALRVHVEFSDFAENYLALGELPSSLTWRLGFRLQELDGSLSLGRRPCAEDAAAKSASGNVASLQSSALKPGTALPQGVIPPSVFIAWVKEWRREEEKRPPSGGLQIEKERRPVPIHPDTFLGR